jgi:hypothetical protein
MVVKTENQELNEKMAMSGQRPLRHRYKESNCEPHTRVDDAGDAERTDYGKLSQWTTGDGKRFLPAGITKEQLPPAVYEIHHSAQLGLYFQKIPVRTEGLLRFPQTNSERVLKEIETFWDRENLFTEFSITYKRGIILWGPPGCLAADTHIAYASYGPDGKRRSHKGGTIERLYQVFNRLIGSGKGRYQIAPKDSVYMVSSVDDEGRIFKNKIVNVVYSGIKKCFKLRTVSGFEIETTNDHKFWNGDKYIALKDLKVGDMLHVHKNTIKNISEHNEKKQRKYWYVKNHPCARTKIIDKYAYKVLSLARAVVEAKMNNLKLDEYKNLLNSNESIELQFLPQDVDVHHKDENCANDSLDNLEIFNHAEHAKHHGMNQDLYYITTPDTIESIVEVGEKETYDIQMEMPYNNFVAANFVVHNSGKTCTVNLIMKDVVDRNGVVIKFTNPGLFIEGMRVLREIQATTPIVVLMEDIDSIIEHYEESPVLNILDGVENISKVIFLATTNYPEMLGPRIVNRPSRFDKRFKIPYPNVESRTMYFKHLCGTKKPEELKIDIKKWVKDTEDFSIAHLKELFVAVIILGDEYAEALENLSKMKEKISSSEDIDKLMGFKR